jgi:hypothetical protein
MKNIILIICINISFTNIYAQKINPKDILSTFSNDPRLQYNNDLAGFAKGLRYHVPIFKQIEARLGINGSTLGDTLYGGIRNEDLYGLNISTNSFREIRLQKMVKQAQIEAINSENRIIEQQALLQRYQALADIHFNLKLFVEKKILDSLVAKKHTILRTMIEQNQDVKVKDVMDTEGDKNTLQLAILDLMSKRKIEEEKLKILTQNIDNQNNIDFTNFISITKIKDIINTVSTNNQHPSIEYYKAQTALSNAQFEYISAQNRQIFNSLRLGYQDPVYLETPKRINPFNNFTVRVGLVVPLPGNNNYKRSDALLELRETQNDAKLAQTINQRNSDFQYIKLNQLQEQYNQTQAIISQSLLPKLLANEKLMAQMTPLEIADLTIAIQKNKVKLSEIEQEITAEYIKLLDYKGVLSTRPLKNYLSNDLEEF